MQDSSGLFAGISGLISFVVAIALIIANWKIYETAGKPGWATLIPIYNLYVFCEIVWPQAPLLAFVLCLIPGVNAIFAIVLLYRLSRVFGQGLLFFLGLLFVAPIFLLILGFGDSTYQP